jgi:hypothetical protein
MEKIKIFSKAERVVAHLPELEEQMGDITFDKLTVPARARLAGHRKTGNHKITQTKGKVDHFVNLEGTAALAVEVGHHNIRDGEFVPGIHVLGTTVFEAEASSGND